MTKAQAKLVLRLTSRLQRVADLGSRLPVARALLQLGYAEAGLTHWGAPDPYRLRQVRSVKVRGRAYGEATAALSATEFWQALREGQSKP